MPPPKISLLLAECGFFSLSEALDDAVNGAPDATLPRWYLRTEEDAISAQFDADRQRLVLRAHIGIVPPPYEARTHSFLLQYNDHCDTTGLRMAVDPEDGEVVLIAELAADALSADTLRYTILELLKRLEPWRGIVADGMTEDKPEPMLHADAGSIRV